MSVWAVVVAAGSGSRFGGFKQYELLGKRRVVDWAVGACRPVVDAVVLAVPPNRPPRVEEKVDIVVAGGATRSSSVRAGLAALPADVEVVVIHDAARPLAARALFEAVIAAVRAGAEGAVPGLPITDTVKRVRDGEVVETLDRSELVCVQTPQAFRADVLRRAHRGDPEATDDAALVEAIGGRVVVVPGDPENIKLTARGDLAGAEQLVNARRPGP